MHVARSYDGFSELFAEPYNARIKLAQRVIAGYAAFSP